MAILSFSHAEELAHEAFQLCLAQDIHFAQELLLRSRTELRRLSGDLPIVGHEATFDDPYITLDTEESPFLTRTFDEACAWGWLELATGVFKLMQDRPGTSLVHFKRAWRIWRPWGMAKVDDEIVLKAVRERIRAALWLGEAWARFMSDRAEPAAHAVLRAAIAELERIEDSALLQETIDQQSTLPPAQLGTPAYRADNSVVPYITSLLKPES